MLDHNGTPTYWQISQNWILQPGGKEGIGIFGNENRHFNPKFSVKRDDRIEVYIWRIDCKAFTQ
jgi:hypothetical protein